LALPALADTTAFTDLGPGGSYDLHEWNVSGISSGFSLGYQSVADQFTASVGGTLSQIDVGLGYVYGTNSAGISVYTDAGGKLGSLLFSGSVFSQPNFGSTSTILATLNPSSGMLVAGNSYFLEIVPGGSDTYDGWNFNSIGAMGTMLFDKGSGYVSFSGRTLGAFDVKVGAASPVPEASTMSLVGIGIAGISIIGAMKKKLA
jgi:hypothetical protein